MFLHQTKRYKDGKEHRYWSLGKAAVAAATALCTTRFSVLMRLMTPRSKNGFEPLRSSTKTMAASSNLNFSPRPVLCRRLPASHPPDGVQLRLPTSPGRGGCWMFTPLWKQASVRCLVAPPARCFLRAPIGKTCVANPLLLRATGLGTCPRSLHQAPSQNTPCKYRAEITGAVKTF